MFKLKRLSNLKVKFQMPSELTSEYLHDRQMHNVCEYNEKNDVAWSYPLNL